MLSNLKSRRATLALIVGSALLLGGAAMPKLRLHNSAMLYVVGEARLIMGDREGGLSLISSAAGQTQDSKSAKSVEPTEPQTSPVPQVLMTTEQTVATKECPRTTKLVQVSSSSKSQGPAFIFAYNDKRQTQYGPSKHDIDKLIEVARLEHPDFEAGFEGVPMDESSKAELKQAAASRSAFAAEKLRNTMAHVRVELERRGVSVPAEAMAPPATPATP